MEKPKRLARSLQAEPTASDGPRPIPGRCLAALQAIFEHLKRQARPGDGRQLGAQGPGVAAATAPVLIAHLPAPELAGGVFGAEQLSRGLRRALHAQFAAVHRRIEAAQWLVLINDWPEVERLWSGLAADLRTPVLELNFLAELVRPRLHEIRVDGHALGDVLDHLNLLQAEIETVLAKRSNLLEMSNLLDYQVAPQVIRLQRFLERLEAAQASAA